MNQLSKDLLSRNTLVYLILLLILGLPLFDTLFPAKVEGVSRTAPILIKLSLVGALFLYFIQNIKLWWFQDSIGQIITLFLIVHLSYLFVSSDEYFTDFYKLSKTFVWYFGYFLFLDFSYKSRINEKWIKNFFFLAIILIAIMVLIQVTNDELFKSNKDYGASNQAYYLLFLMPFLFIFRDVKYRILLFGLIAVCVAISMKRGTMLLFAIMILYMIFFSNMKDIVSKRFSTIFKISVIVILLIVVQQFVLTNLGIYEEKFSDITEFDNENIYAVGSGRGALYLLPLERWIESNLFHFIFGYGFNATPDFYPTTGVLSKGFYAHSDVVMIIHDYGLIGLIILFTLFKRLYSVSIRSVLPIHRVPLFLLFIAITVKSFVSGFILYDYSIFGFALIGYIVGSQYQIEESNSNLLDAS